MSTSAFGIDHGYGEVAKGMGYSCPSCGYSSGGVSKSMKCPKCGTTMKNCEVSKAVPGAKLLRALTTPGKLEETEVVTSAGKRTIRTRKPTKYFEGEHTDVITHDHNGNVTGHIAPSRAALNRHGAKTYAGIGAGIIGGTAAATGGAAYAVGRHNGRNS